MRRYSKYLIVLALLIVVVVIVTRLPRGYDTDISQVGGGQPAIVVVHDHNFVQSTELLGTLNRLRGDYESGLLFLMADMGRSEGVQFGRTHGLDIAMLGFFSADGRLLDVYRQVSIAPDDDDVRRWIEENVAR